MPLLVLGAGQGMLVVPLYGTILGGVPAHHAGMGGGILITTTQMALGLGSALVGTLFLQLGGATGGPAPVDVVLAASGLVLAPGDRARGPGRGGTSRRPGRSQAVTLEA